MKKTVFISSTYKDLEDYRTEVWKTLEEFNVNISGMEKFGARKSNPLETCLKEVKKSDIFIVIIGMVYGSTEKISGKSYTELEYEQALKNNLDIYVYLIDENSTVFPIKHIDFIHHKELDLFKSRLKNHTVDFFMDPKDLADKINIVLNTLTNNLVVKRPTVIPGKLFNFMVDKKYMILCIGYFKGSAFEIYVPTVGNFFKHCNPDYNRSCRIEKAGFKEFQHHALIFYDKQGYEISFPVIGGLFKEVDYSNDLFNLSNTITELLRDSKSINEISNFLTHKLLFTNSFSEKVKTKVIELLQDNFNQNK